MKHDLRSHNQWKSETEQLSVTIIIVTKKESSRLFEGLTVPIDRPSQFLRSCSIAANLACFVLIFVGCDCVEVPWPSELSPSSKVYPGLNSMLGRAGYLLSCVL